MIYYDNKFLFTKKADALVPCWDQLAGILIKRYRVIAQANQLKVEFLLIHLNNYFNLHTCLSKDLISCDNESLFTKRAEALVQYWDQHAKILIKRYGVIAQANHLKLECPLIHLNKYFNSMSVCPITWSLLTMSCHLPKEQKLLFDIGIDMQRYW